MPAQKDFKIRDKLSQLKRSSTCLKVEVDCDNQRSEGGILTKRCFA